MTSVTIHGTSGLVTSSVIHSGKGGLPTQTACLNGNMMYNGTELMASCPFPKTQEKCMDDLRSRSIFQNIPETGDLSFFANALSICTPGMKTLVEEINLDQQSSATDRTRANELTQICKF
jgi:hypothetical protein